MEKVDEIAVIEVERLLDHPDNPNVMSGANFNKLLANIRQTGRYQPLVVRPHPQQKGMYQVLNGHHRRDALARLGAEEAQCVVWDVDDDTADVLLGSLNRLTGRDELGRKLALLRRMSERVDVSELSKILPHTRDQLKKMVSLKGPGFAPKVSEILSAMPVVFFLDAQQKQVLDRALQAAQPEDQTNKAKARATALAAIMDAYLQTLN